MAAVHAAAPHDPEPACKLLFLRRQLCDFRDGAALFARVRTMALAEAAGARAPLQPLPPRARSPAPEASWEPAHHIPERSVPLAAHPRNPPSPSPGDPPPARPALAPFNALLLPFSMQARPAARRLAPPRLSRRADATEERLSKKDKGQKAAACTAIREYTRLRKAVREWARVLSGPVQPKL